MTVLFGSRFTRRHKSNKVATRERLDQHAAEMRAASTTLRKREAAIAAWARRKNLEAQVAMLSARIGA